MHSSEIVNVRNQNFIGSKNGKGLEPQLPQGNDHRKDE